MNTITEAALAALDAGIAVIPIRADGTKAPAIGEWNPYRETLPTVSQVKTWMRSTSGFACLCGPGSNYLELLDFDDADICLAFFETADAVGLGPLVDRIRAGYAESTPSGGAHLIYYCPEVVAGNTPLARRPGPDPAKPKWKAEPLIETRGDGGYFIAAPSNGAVHPDGGAWELLSGGFDTIVTITAEERNQLFQLARTFDEMPPENVQDEPRATVVVGDGLRPGDDFIQRHSTVGEFRKIIEPHGWKLTHRRGDVGYFRRPGKNDSWSASFNHGGFGFFVVFSTSTEFETDRGYSPFSVYGILNHRGDWKAAATELAKQGHGKKPTISLGTVRTGKRSEQKAQAAFSPAPMPGDAITGWFREYVDLVSPTAESSDSFHMAVAVSFVGSCIGKRIGFHHASDKLYPNFYTLLIGPTGSARKDTAIRRMIDMFYIPPPQGQPLIATQIPFQIVRDISSAEGLIAMLRKRPNLLLYAAEFTKVMSNAERESTKSIGPTLIEAFDTPPSMQNNTKANIENDREPMEARNPFVSVITSVQPEELSRIISGQHQYSGFLNRWWLIQGKGVGARPDPPFVDEKKAWQLMRRMTKTVLEYDDGTLLKMDAAAVEAWSEWYVSSYPTGDETSQEDAMGVRRGTIVKKIALVHAVMDGAKTIRAEHIEIGVQLSDWAWEHTRRLLPTWGESKDAEMERKILEQLTRRGAMTKRSLQQLTGNRLGPGVFSRIIKSMVENGDIIVGEGNVVAISDGQQS